MSTASILHSIRKFIRRPAVVVSLLIVLAIGAVMGTDAFRSLSADIRTYNNVIKNLLAEYVDDIDSRQLITSSIEGMLKDLDPYTVFIRESDQSGINMLTKGSYGGVGIRLGMRKKILTVIAPMEGTPAHRAGIRPGDQIIRIDSLYTKDFTTDKAARIIRGKPGSEVTLTFSRPGESELIPIKLIREKIKINDMPYYGMEDGIGYINLTRFSRDTAKQVAGAITALQDDGMRGLILDLRGNPGGLLRDAVAMVDAMVEPGLAIVDTRGRSRKSTRSYRSEKEPVLKPEIHLVILVNGGSASASEIVAGAIQDLDRGVVIGSTTFGKGLVQSIFPLGKKTSIKMTTAKYYIPSGRLIQKEDYLHNGVLTDNSDHLDSLFVTSRGRVVKGGGGLTPDISMDKAPLPPLTRRLWSGGHFFAFATEHQNKYDLTPPVEVSDQIIADFREYVDGQEITLIFPGEKDLAKFEETIESLESFEGAVNFGELEAYFEIRKAGVFDDELEEIRRGLELELSSVKGGLAARIRASLTKDDIYLKAVALLSDPLAYEKLLMPDEERAQLGSR